MLTQCWIDVGPPSTTLARHQINISAMYRAMCTFTMLTADRKKVIMQKSWKWIVHSLGVISAEKSTYSLRWCWWMYIQCGCPTCRLWTSHNYTHFRIHKNCKLKYMFEWIWNIPIKIEMCNYLPHIPLRGRLNPLPEATYCERNQIFSLSAWKSF